MGPAKAFSDRERGKGLLLLLAICVLLAGCKLWLVGEDEIVAAGNPLDQIRYLQMAQELIRGAWLGDFDRLTLIREPGYPLWIALNYQLGLSLRLANELLLLAGAALFCASLLSAGVSSGVAAAAFAVLVFEPHSFVVNRDALPASFYLSVLLCALAGLIWSHRASGLRRVVSHAAWVGLALGVLWATRPEKPILLLPVAVIALFDVASGRRRGHPWTRVLGRGAAMVGATACGIAVVVGCVSTVNYRHYGVFATAGVGGSGYLAANRALLGIEHDAPRRFVPVPRDVRSRAYAVSPAFRELAPVLEKNDSWARGVSCNIDRVCDDIGGGYFRWLLREAVAAAGHMDTHGDSERFFRRVAAELTAACRSGELKCRPAHASFLHPYPKIWLPHVGASLQRLVRVGFGSGTPRFWDAPLDPPYTTAALRRFFDRLAGRSGPTRNGRVTLRGRVSAVADPIEEVVLRTSRQRVTSSVEAGGFSEDAAGRRELAFAFAFDKRARDFAVEEPVLRFEHRSGKITELGLLRLLSTRESGDALQVTIDAFEEDGRENRIRRIVRTALWRVHPLGYAALSILGLLAIALLLLRRRGHGSATPELAVVSVLLVLAIGRLTLLAIVDASSFPARSSRHLLLAVPFWGCAMLLLIEAGVRSLRRSFESGKSGAVDAD